jgi:MinD-like ATPase involved in chromosome partitioning or flagellar assembly
MFSKEKGKVYVGVSPRGGVGLTTTLLNLAYNVDPKLKTLYVDLDSLNPGGTCLLGMERENSIWNVITGTSAKEDFIYRVEDFYTMPLYIFKSQEMASYLDDEEDIMKRILDVIMDLRRKYDIIFIDTLPGYTITSVKAWQKFDHLIGVGNYNIQSISGLLQVVGIFEEWTNRNLMREFEGIIFVDTGNHNHIDEKVLRELFINIPIYTLPYTREFYSSPPIAKEDLLYMTSVRRILKNLGVKTKEK